MINITQHYLTYAAGKRALVFCNSVAMAGQAIAQFLQVGIRADAITGTTHHSLRKSVVDRFNDGSVPVLCLINADPEELGLNPVEAVIVMKPTHSGVLHARHISSAAPTAVIIDLAGNTYRHGIPNAFEGRVFAPQPIDLVDFPGSNGNFDLAALKAAPTDADILAWLERNHTLHRCVEALYVVDGYQVTITYDDSPIKGPWHGETLRDAYIKAMGEWDTTHGNVDLLKPAQ